MVQHFFVTNRQNNARWIKFYTADVLNLTFEDRSAFKLDNVLGVRFRGVSMGSRATLTQQTEMQREAVA